jgi:DNA-binding response OmpR family regulator
MAIKVLLVDDDPMITMLVKQIIGTREEFDLSTASSGAEGVSLARELKPDVIMMDQNLGDGDGLDFVVQLRNDPDPEVQKLCAILCTAADDPDRLPNYQEAKLLGVISKPFNPSGLAWALRNLLKRADES